MIYPFSDKKSIISFANQSKWTGFHNKTPEQRLQIISDVSHHDASHCIEGRENVLQPIDHRHSESQWISRRSYGTSHSNDHRHDALQSINHLHATDLSTMSENVIGCLQLPLSVIPYLMVNGYECLVPMCTEESSVVAAVSSALKTIRYANSQESLNASHCVGFTASIQSDWHCCDGQIALFGLSFEQLSQIVMNNKQALIDAGNSVCPSMVKRGHGVKDLWLKNVKRQSVRNESVQSQCISNVHVQAESIRNESPRNESVQVSQQTVSALVVLEVRVGVADSMGANCVNRVLLAIRECLFELILSNGILNSTDLHIKPACHSVDDLQNYCGGYAIVSNDCPFRMVNASFKIPISSDDGHFDLATAKGIIRMQQWAQQDPRRAATHIKGIMNGVMAVAMATGQDTRAINAAVYSWVNQTRGIHNTDHDAVNERRTINTTDHNTMKDTRDMKTTDYDLIKDTAVINTTDYKWESNTRAIHTSGCLTEYEITDDGQYLKGSISLPLPVATVGGCIGVHPGISACLDLIFASQNSNGSFVEKDTRKCPHSSSELAVIMACIGLASNFAALRAISSKQGIQKGHMTLHSANILASLSSEIPTEYHSEIRARMISTNRFSASDASMLAECKVMCPF